MKTKKHISFIIRIMAVLLIAVLPCVFAGCKSNEITFYFGISKIPDENSKLEMDSPTVIEQSKEKIENSNLVFYENDNGTFDNMHLCFTGNNIKSVTATSENRTVFYNYYDVRSRCLDSFTFYCTIDEAEMSCNYFKPETLMESKWDNGQFDDIKNVYFNGMSLYDMSRARKDETKDIAGVNTNIEYIDNVEDAYRANNPYYYLDREIFKEEISKEVPILYTRISMQYIDGAPVVKDGTDERNLLIQGDSVETNHNVKEDSFIYRYEKLFYNSQQSALEEKGSFSYSDLVGETLKIQANYIGGSTQTYSLDISFDETGNIIAELSLSE